ncbi:unnamed protein product [Urochloa humidicola]
MPMLAAVTCLARRRRMHCRSSDAAPELDQGQHGLAGDHRHRWRDEPAPVAVGIPGHEQTGRLAARAPLSGRQGRSRLLQEEARFQHGRGSSAAMVSKKAAPAAGGARAGTWAASPSSLSEASSSSSLAVLCAVCLEEVRRGETAAALPCSHSYHPGCVLPWLAAHGDCPCCRAAVPSGELVPTFEIDLM